MRPKPLFWLLYPYSYMDDATALRSPGRVRRQLLDLCILLVLVYFLFEFVDRVCVSRLLFDAFFQLLDCFRQRNFPSVYFRQVLRESICLLNARSGGDDFVLVDDASCNRVLGVVVLGPENNGSYVVVLYH